MSPILNSRMPAPRFWTRTAFLFAAGGLFAYLVSLALFETGSAWLLIAASLMRLLLGIAPAARIARRFGWHSPASLYPLALALPYPVNLALFVYGKRFQWLPFDAARTLSGPTATLIFLTGVLLASRWITDAAVRRVLSGQQEERLRLLGRWLFALTAIGVVLVPSPLSPWFLHYIAEPIALIGYATLIGQALP
jgi:hypothetical protein